jgi:hypothetical protein
MYTYDTQGVKMSSTPQPNTEPPICTQCEAKATWDSKFADWWCFECDDGSPLTQATKTPKIDKED